MIKMLMKMVPAVTLQIMNIALNLLENKMMVDAEVTIALTQKEYRKMEHAKSAQSIKEQKVN